MAIEADRVVVALIGDTSNLDSNVSGAERNFTRAMSSIERSAASAEKQIVQSSNASAFAARNLGFQLSDIGVQLSGGQSPFLIISQQGPQVVQALQEISASGAGLGQVLRTVALPGFLSILGILGPFVAQLLAGANATDTKKDATKALTEAINDMVKATDQAISSGTREIQVSEGLARAKLAEAQARREAAKASLQGRVAELEAQRSAPGLSTNGFQQAGNAGVAAAAEGISELKRQIAQLDVAAQQAQVAVRNAETRAARQRVTERTDPRAGAQGRYERGEINLNNLRRAGLLTTQQYEDQLTKLTETRDRDIKAIGDAAKAERKREADAKRAAKEQARELDQLRNKLNSVERQYDPTAAASREFAADLATIGEAMNRGIITPARAAELRLKAIEARMQSWLNTVQGAKDALGTDQIFGNTADRIDDEQKRREERSTQARIRADERFQQQQQRKAEDNIHDLADIYETLFTDGTENFWDDFKRQGLRALAILAAQKTLSLLTGQDVSLSDGRGLGFIGNSIFGALGGKKDFASGIGGDILGLASLFGRASGGYVAPGQTVRVNENRGGVELLRMGSQGGSIIPLGRTDAVRPSASQTVVNAPQFNLKGAVVTRELYADMERIANQSAARTSSAVGRQVLQAVPGRMTQYQNDGT
ncbi:phage tail length tape measure family protein [Sphingomonas sp.]|uniref:phage tail length tape measure family protein n=1 Tax=Sphingomonas sp. TaxID=28214 RepID=UPI002FD88291